MFPLFLATQFILSSPSWAQECPTGCIDIDILPPECLPVPDPCPLQAMPSSSHGAVSWLNDNGTWKSSANGTWQAEGYSVESPYVAHNFTYPMIGEGASTGYYEWSCAILDGSGALNCFGYSTILSHPTGGEPYSALSSGSTGRFGVLDSTGRVRIWGNTAGTFGSSLPTTTGFTELGVGRDVGCAVGIADGGVTCWGSVPTIVSNVNKPTSGTYTAVEVAVGVAGAVQDDGTLDIWCDTTSVTCTSFIANGPVPGQRGIPTDVTIVSWEANETGYPVGAAMLSDGSVYLWTTSNNTAPDGVHHAAMFDDYGVPANRYYIPQGPDGPMTWRSRVENSATDYGRLCGVVDDPNGATDGSSSYVPYEFGEVICWGGSNAGQYPARYAACETSS